MNQEATPCPGFDAALADATKVLRHCEDDRRLFDEGAQPSVLFERSIYYWVYYPDLLSRIWLAESTGVAESLVKEAATTLDHVYDRAVIQLMAYLKQAGMDSTPIHAAANLCRTLYQSDFPRYFAADRRADTWPETLGSTLLELSEFQQQLILSAQALLQSWVVKISGEKSPSKSSPPSTEASGQGNTADDKVSSTPSPTGEANSRQQLQDCEVLAYLAYDYARTKTQNPKLIAKEAYDFWSDGERGLADEDRNTFPRLVGYHPGKFSSFKSQLSRARNHPSIDDACYGGAKQKEPGGSVVRSKDV